MVNGVFEEIEFAYDLQEYLEHSKDVKIDASLKNEVMALKKDQLLSVTKKIQSPLEIVAYQIVDEDFVNNKFPSIKP